MWKKILVLRPLIENQNTDKDFWPGKKDIDIKKDFTFDFIPAKMCPMALQESGKSESGKSLISLWVFMIKEARWTLACEAAVWVRRQCRYLYADILMQIVVCRYLYVDICVCTYLYEDLLNEIISCRYIYGQGICGTFCTHRGCCVQN